MSEKHYWCGYMEAGEKSGPVLRDSRIDTDNPETIYLFNLKRNEILEYRRDIIEPKLRELNSDEQAFCGELKTAYGKVRSGFTPRGGKVAAIPVKERSKPPVVAANDDDKDVDEFEDADDVDWLEEEA